VSAAGRCDACGSCFGGEGRVECYKMPDALPLVPCNLCPRDACWEPTPRRILLPLRPAANSPSRLPDWAAVCHMYLSGQEARGWESCMRVWCPCTARRERVPPRSRRPCPRSSVHTPRWGCVWCLCLCERRTTGSSDAVMCGLCVCIRVHIKKKFWLETTSLLRFPPACGRSDPSGGLSPPRWPSSPRRRTTRPSPAA